MVYKEFDDEWMTGLAYRLKVHAFGIGTVFDEELDQFKIGVANSPFEHVVARFFIHPLLKQEFDHAVEWDLRFTSHSFSPNESSPFAGGGSRSPVFGFFQTPLFHS